MSGGFGPFCKTVSGAVTCKAFNDAGSGNESQVENESVKTKLPFAWWLYSNLWQWKSAPYFTTPSTRFPMIGSLYFSCWYALYITKIQSKKSASQRMG